LGYGRGQLLFKITGKTGKWTFNPKYEFNKHDNLPEDAWIGFLSNPKQPFSTRINTRPFTIDEQKKILTVGTCLICHTKNYKKVFLPLSDAPNIKRKISKKCILPTW